MVLYIALSTPAEEQVTREISLTFVSRFQQLAKGFRRLHPNLVVQLSLYPQDQLLRQVRKRSLSGLGPDLIVTTADGANALLHHHLTRPMPLSRDNASEIAPLLLHRVTSANGQISALPLALYTQLACFDRRRVPQPPTTVRQLLALSADGVRVGMALQLRDLFWTAGSLGAVPALLAAAEQRDPNPRERQGLLTWMQWLQSANIQRSVTFQAQQTELREGLSRGHFDWISCSSSDLPLLRSALGPHLGVSNLPRGEGGDATPVNVLRVMALGINSSGAQREMAIALSRYSLRPLVQRNMALESEVFLPVNRHVTMPVESSGTLATLEAAGRQGEDAAALLARLHAADPRVAQLEQVLVALVFGSIEPEQALASTLTILHHPR